MEDQAYTELRQKLAELKAQHEEVGELVDEMTALLDKPEHDDNSHIHDSPAAGTTDDPGTEMPSENQPQAFDDDKKV